MARFCALLVAMATMAAGEDCETCDGAAMLQTQGKITTDSDESDSMRDCAALLENEECDYAVEPKAQFHCEVEHASRMVYATWIQPGAKVLEVGARYGHATCMLSKVLGLDQKDGTAKLNSLEAGSKQTSGAQLFSSDADPKIWDVLEGNLAKKGCGAQVVRGTVGSKSFKLVNPTWMKRDKNATGYSAFTSDANDPRPGVVVPAHSVASLNVTFDTLAIDCEGCFKTFLKENPDLLKTLKMIIVEVHPGAFVKKKHHKHTKEEKVVDQLVRQGWELKHSIMDQRVLCRGPCQPHCNLNWLENHARTYYGKEYF